MAHRDELVSLKETVCNDNIAMLSGHFTLRFLSKNLRDACFHFRLGFANFSESALHFLENQGLDSQ